MDDLALKLLPSSDPGFVQIGINNVHVQCSGKYKYKTTFWPHVPKGDGSVKVTVSQTSAVVGVKVGITSDGHPDLAVADGDCKVNVKITGLTFGGGLTSDILNLFKSPLKKAISSALNGSLCGIVKSLVKDELNPIAKSYSTTVKLPIAAPLNHAIIDYSLISRAATKSLTAANVAVKAQMYGDHDIGTPPVYSVCPLPEAIDCKFH